MSVNEIAIFSVGARSAVSIPGEENFIPAKNLPLHRRKPGSSLLSMEGLLGRSPPGEAFWPSGTVGASLPLGRKLGFGYSGCPSRKSSIMTISGGVPPGENLILHGAR